MIEKDCEEKCFCQNDGTWKCEPRCSGDFVQIGKNQNINSTCSIKPTEDDCCVKLDCKHDDELKPMVSLNPGIKILYFNNNIELKIIHLKYLPVNFS